MPKMKTNRAAYKRFRRTGTGKIMHFSTGHRHLLEKKRTRRKRTYRKKVPVPASEAQKVKSLLPYLGST